MLTIVVLTEMLILNASLKCSLACISFIFHPKLHIAILF